MYPQQQYQPPFNQPKSSSILKVVLSIVGAFLLLALGILVGLLLAHYLNLNDSQPSLSEEPDASDQQSGLDLSDQRPKPKIELPDDLEEEDLEDVEAIYDLLRERYDGELTYDEILDSLKKGLVQSTQDPYSQYHNYDEAQALNDRLRGHLIGIGAELHLDDQGRVVVVSPLRGGPAERAGLMTHDIILAVDGQSVVGQSLQEVVSKIRGELDTTVTLSIQRLNSDRTHADDHLQLEMVREEINVPSVSYEIKNDIGILVISSFHFDDPDGKQTVELAIEAAQALRKADVKGIVLDLRYNPGGSLDATQGVGGLWLKPGQAITYVGVIDGELEALPAKGEDSPLLANIPLVVLINEGSASASEIIIGALRDYGIGQTVGQTTYGKGSVQTLIPLDNSDLLRLTTSHWYTPDKKSIDDGIEPDIEVENDPDTAADEQMEKALEILR